MYETEALSFSPWVFCFLRVEKKASLMVPDILIWRSFVSWSLLFRGFALTFFCSRFPALRTHLLKNEEPSWLFPIQEPRTARQQPQQQACCTIMKVREVRFSASLDGRNHQIRAMYRQRVGSLTESCYDVPIPTCGSQEFYLRE